MMCCLHHIKHLLHMCFIIYALAEEIAVSESDAYEPDTAESRTQQSETKALSLSRELEDMRDK